jgi:hypothetical protein
MQVIFAMPGLCMPYLSNYAVKCGLFIWLMVVFHTGYLHDYTFLH